MSDPKKMAYVFHGDSSLSVGDTLYNAFDNIESLEHYCKVSIYARSLNALEHCTCDELKGELARRESAPAAACASCTKNVCDGSCKTSAPAPSANTMAATAAHAAGVPASADVNEVIRRVLANLNK